MGSCCGEGMPSHERVFDKRAAEGDLRRHRRNGAPWSTRELVDQLADGLDLREAAVVDIGAGIGAVHLALLERGARRATDIDGSSAYLDAARDEAVRLGLEDRVEHVLGDATVVGRGVEPGDLVALDRVICCFGDLPGLLGAATALASRRVGLVYPRDPWWMRLVATVANPVVFGRSGGYRMQIHRRATVEAIMTGAGFGRRGVRDGRVWRVETWERSPLA